MLEAWQTRLRQARPYLRWAGGKQYFLYQFAERIPALGGSYIEPFLGSGAVFFKVIATQKHPPESRLGDTNQQLIQTFLAVRDDPMAVSERLEWLQDEYSRARDRSEFYYRQRDLYNATLPRPEPALFIFLNRTCWNGLYRVNRRGRFNVPYGAPKSATVVPSTDDILNASAALAQAKSLRATTWQNTLAFAKQGDFVFLDPPYFSELLITDHRNPTKYQRREFSVDEHHELAEAAELLARRNVDFMLTNSAEPEMIELYEDHNLQVAVIQAPRPINSRTERRGRPVTELLVTPSNADYGILPDSLPGMGIEDVAPSTPNDDLDPR